MLNEQIINNTKEMNESSSVKFPWTIYETKKEQEKVVNNQKNNIVNESVVNSVIQQPETFWF